jgi:hypothetical protein
MVKPYFLAHPSEHIGAFDWLNFTDLRELEDPNPRNAASGISNRLEKGLSLYLSGKHGLLTAHGSVESLVLDRHGRGMWLDRL